MEAAQVAGVTGLSMAEAMELLDSVGNNVEHTALILLASLPPCLLETCFLLASGSLPHLMHTTSNCTAKRHRSVVCSPTHMACPALNFPTWLAKVTEAVNKHFSSGVETRRQESPAADFGGGGGESTERPSAGETGYSAWQEVANVTGLARQEAEQILLATGNDVRNTT